MQHDRLHLDALFSHFETLITFLEIIVLLSTLCLSTERIRQVKHVNCCCVCDGELSQLTLPCLRYSPLQKYLNCKGYFFVFDMR